MATCFIKKFCPLHWAVNGWDQHYEVFMVAGKASFTVAVELERQGLCLVYSPHGTLVLRVGAACRLSRAPHVLTLFGYPKMKKKKYIYVKVESHKRKIYHGHFSLARNCVLTHQLNCIFHVFLNNFPILSKIPKCNLHINIYRNTQWSTNTCKKG